MVVSILARSFMAEINRQVKAAERRSQQQERAQYRDQQTAIREAEKARKAAARAENARHRAAVADQKATAKEAKRLHLEARLAEVEEMNAELAASYADIDTILEATLAVDDWVDLESLRLPPVAQPPFSNPRLERAEVEPAPLVYPPQPAWEEPEAPTGLSAKLGGAKRHEKAVAQARAEHDAALQAWHQEATAVHTRYCAKLESRENREKKRLAKLKTAREEYDRECARRDTEAAEQNAQLDHLINDLAFDVESAIEEYIGIVLGNSIYPDSFPVTYDHDFDLTSRELTLSVEIPAPDDIPGVKTYRYVKTRDEITSTNLAAKVRKDRYASALAQVGVRTLHEVFEADRQGKVEAISLTVGVTHLDPATGLEATVPLLAVAADREAFNAFDLSNVEPTATLEHLGASISKKPLELVPADTSRGVRATGG